MIEILKASAGAGKTYRLVRKYIELLLGSIKNLGPEGTSSEVDYMVAYRHILAVTFTNKATQEMKDRIMKELHVLSLDPTKSGYYKYLVANWNTLSGIFEKKIAYDKEVANVFNSMSQEQIELAISQIASLSGKMLYGILHDYGSFSVSTIDKFFQQVLRAFSREIGYFSSYDIELDKEALVEESVERILDSVSEVDPRGRNLLIWMLASVEEQLYSKQKFNLNKSLIEMSKELKSDEFKDILEQYNIPMASSENGVLYPKIYSKTELEKLRKDLNKEVVEKFEENVLNICDRIDEVLNFEGLDYTSFSGGKRSWMNTIGKIRIGIKEKIGLPELSKTFKNNCRVPEQWFTRTKTAKLLTPNLERTLGPLLEELLLCIDVSYITSTSQSNPENASQLTILDYNTAKIIIGQIYSLGIAGELFVEFDKVMKENNVLSIDESNDILRKIIDGTNAPFIYEKLGVRYENFLLDEFQDTSTVQWNNFSPLLEESLSMDNSNLIVGDVKQSIYRWRGSDWRLLGNKVKDEFLNTKKFGKNQVVEETLEYNFRTTENVVTFNNELFRFFSGILDKSLRESNFIGEKEDYIKKIYSTVPVDFDQKVCPKMSADNAYKGIVKATFLSKPNKSNDEYKLSVFETIKNSVDNILNNGGKLSDIAILVRTNIHGAEVASYLLDRGINVISGDSLAVKSSIAVRRIVSLLSLIESSSADDLNTYLCDDLGIDIDDFKSYHSLLDLVEMIIRAIKEKSHELGRLDTFKGHIPYLQAFEDEVKKWTESKKGDLSDFLEYWESKNPKISSPTDVDAVKVMTVHSSKGLEFPYVIFPFIESITLSKPDQSWCVLDVDDSFMSKFKGVYSVSFSKAIMETHFKADYINDKKLQYVDNLNVVYVSLTRPVKGLHLIGALQGCSSKSGFTRSLDNGVKPDLDKFKDFSNLLYYYLLIGNQHIGELKFNNIAVPSSPESTPINERFEYVETECDEIVKREYQFGKLDIQNQQEDQKKNNILEFDLEYPSYPLNPEIVKIDENGEEVVVGEQGRLKFSQEAIDYFSQEGGIGREASKKQFGIVMHDILADVISVKDVPKAVQSAYLLGDINNEDKAYIEKFLINKINSVSDRGWFPEDANMVLNETALLDSQGSNYRPDRVVKTENGQINVIDYKFGEKSKKYLKQVRGYARLYKEMGYKDVKAYLWYMHEKNDEKTEQKYNGIVEVRLN